jgi:hypothetical protein
MHEQSRVLSEERLEALKEQARVTGAVTGKTVPIIAGPLPQPSQTREGIPAGYHGLPVLKAPVWTWEIPLYFFIGGIAGMAPVIALGAWLGQQDIALARVAMWVATIGAIISAALLTKDLGRPGRFINMLRVFKWRSPMSVGSWALTFFGGAATLGAIATEVMVAMNAGIGSPAWLNVLTLIFVTGAALLGVIVATYTGVLIAATAIPAWFSHRAMLPLHFGVTALGSSAAVFELMGFRLTALNAIGITAAAIETLLLLWIEFKGKGVIDAPLRHGLSGWMIRVAGILLGPVALALRLFGLIPFAVGAFLIGALANRYGWLQAGRDSAGAPEALFAAQKRGGG